MAMPRFKNFGSRVSRFKQALVSSEKRTDNETKQLEREIATEEKDQKDVERSENRKLKLDKSDKRLVNSAIIDLRFCQTSLKTWRLNAALKNINGAIRSVQMLMQSEGIKMQLTQLQRQEEGRDVQITHAEEQQTRDEEQQTKAREQMHKKR